MIANAYESRMGIAGVVAATVVGGVVPALLQCVTGSVAAVGFAAVTHTTDRSWQTLLRLRPDLAGSSWLGMPRSGQFAVAFGLGASVSVLIEQMTTGRSGWRTMRPVIARSALFTAVGGAGVSFLLSSTAEVARRFDATRPAADALLRWATNPLVWFVLFTVLAVVAWRGSAEQPVALRGEARLDELLEGRKVGRDSQMTVDPFDVERRTEEGIAGGEEVG